MKDCGVVPIKREDIPGLPNYIRPWKPFTNYSNIKGRDWRLAMTLMAGLNIHHLFMLVGWAWFHFEWAVSRGLPIPVEVAIMGYLGTLVLVAALCVPASVLFLAYAAWPRKVKVSPKTE